MYKILTITWLVYIVRSGLAESLVESEYPSNKCVVTIDGLTILKNVGDTWNTLDNCIKGSCKLDESGIPQETFHKKDCDISCSGEYEYEIIEGQCCGRCVKTKCLYETTYYSAGEVWKSMDNCTIFECSKIENGSFMTLKYQKSCQDVSHCSPKNLYFQDCCKICQPENDYAKSTLLNDDQHDNFMNAEIYEIHPCIRNCEDNQKPLICQYKFMLEHYETLSKACYNCPNNVTDCYRPHCIAADGVRRTILTVNRMMPGPKIEVCLGDTVSVDVVNHLVGDTSTLHWHGLSQKSNPYMDGVPMVTQCPIVPGTTFRYTFIADTYGTHFWHSHTGMQRGDGVFGSLIIKKPRTSEKYSNLYDFDLSEHIILLQDWAHQPGVSMFAAHHHSIGDNKPVNILINGKGKYFERKLKIDKKIAENKNFYSPFVDTNSSTNVSKNLEDNDIIFVTTTSRQKRSPVNINEESEMIPFEVFYVNKENKYRFRLINAEFLNCPMELSVDSHNLTVFSTDGNDVEPIEVSSFVSYAGERFDFIINANQEEGNYWIRVRGLMDCDERFTSAYQLAILRYVGANNDSYPSNIPTYDFVRDGIQLNALNKGTGNSNTVSIAEVSSIEEDDPRLTMETPDYKFYVYYDFYAKNNSHFHVPGLYGFNQINSTSNKLFTPQLNHISMKMPNMPFLIGKDNLDESTFCNESHLISNDIDCINNFCECTHVLQVKLNSVVELIMIDEGFTYDANHPFHLHGHSFRVLAMERVSSNVTIEQIKELDKNGKIKRNFKNAPIKDTVTVPDGGYTVIRFIADNPGYWLFHCHIEFHAEIGMALVFKVGNNNEMKKVPPNFPSFCSDYMPELDSFNSANYLYKYIFTYILIIFYWL